MKKRFKHQMKILLILFGLVAAYILVPKVTVQAARKTVYSGVYALPSHTEFDEVNNNVKTFDVTISKKSVLVAAFKVTAKDEIFSGGLRIELFNSNGKRIQNDYDSLKDFETGDWEKRWYWNDDLMLKPGKYKYRITNSSDGKVSLNLKVYAYDKIAKNAKIKKKAKIKGGNWVKIGKISTKQAPIPGKISISNSKVINNYDIEANGNIWVYGNKSGSSTVTVKFKGGKKYKCKVTVTAPDPNYFANVYGYYTRNNYFLVRFKNNGSEKLVIHSAGAYSMEDDYKEYDRKLYISGGKDVVIKPGRSKKVKFKVRGYTTWPDYQSHTVRYYFSYGGKKHLGSVWYEDSTYKSGKKWYSTYWSSDEEDYEEWLE